MTLLLTVAALMNFPKVQTAVGRKVAEIVSNRIDGNITFDGIYLSIPNRIIIDSPCITSSASDTLFVSERLSVTIDATSLLKGEYKVHTFFVKGGFFNLHTYPDGHSIITDVFGAPKDTSSSKIQLCASLRKLELKDFRYRMLDEYRPVPDIGHAMNFSDLDVSGITLYCDKIRFCSDTLKARIKSLSAREKSGYVLEKLSGEVTVGPEGVNIDDLLIEDRWSRVRSTYLKLGFHGVADLNDFISKVNLGANFRDTYLDFTTLSYFAGSLEKMKLKLLVDGDVSGPVVSLHSRSLYVRSSTEESIIDLGFSLVGLDEPDVAMLDVQIRNCRTTCADVARILASLNDGPVNPTVAGFAPGEVFTFSGSLDGFFTDLVAFGRLDSNLGAIDVDMLMGSADAENFKLTGNIAAVDFEAGRFIDNDRLGSVSLSATASANIASDRKNTSVRLDTLAIDRIRFNGYDYGMISGNGSLRYDEFEGMVRGDDPNLNFLFHGLLHLIPDSRLSRYNFDLWLGNADLHALNFDKRDTSRVSFHTSVDLDRTKEGAMTGDVGIDDLVLTEPGGKHPIDHIGINFRNDDLHHEVRLQSGIADASFEGNAPILDFVSDLKSLTLNSEFWNLSSPRYASAEPIGHEYSFSLLTGGLEDVLSFFAPGVFIAPGTSLDLSLSANDSLTMRSASDLVAFGNSLVRNLTVEGHNGSQMLSVDLGAEALHLGALKLSSNRLSLTGDDNVAGASYSCFNEGDPGSSARLDLAVEFTDTLVSPYRMVASIFKSNVDLYGDRWTIEPAKVSMRKGFFDIDGLHIHNGDRSIMANGKVSASPRDSISVEVSDLDLMVFNPFLSSVDGLDLKGVLNVDGTAAGVLGTPMIDMNGDIDGLYAFGKEMGDLLLTSEYDDDKKAFDISLLNIMGKEMPLRVDGTFAPQTGLLALNSSLKDFSIDCFAPLASSVFSELSGGLSGDISVSGPLDSLSLACENGHFDDVRMRIDFTDVPYTLNGPFTIDDKGIHFDNIALRDDYNGTGTVSGGIDLGGFRNIVLDTRVRLENALGLDNGPLQSPSFYGRLFCDGRVRINGPLNDLALSVTATTLENTSLYIPLGNAAAQSNKILTFINSNEVKDVYSVYDSLLVAHDKMNVSPSRLAININATATPEAEVNLELNKTSGDVVKARGQGMINVAIDDSKSLFDLKGDYTITEGDYRFVFMGLAARDFTVDPGGTIKFNGNIMDSDLNLSAKYRTKASIGTLIADTTSVSSRRNVDCFINATGKLSNPQMNLSMDIPDLDPTTKGRVETALNTEDKVMKQFVSLLLSGSFLPDEQSGIVNNTTLLYSNASEMLANQVNNILKQLDIPLDIGFNYQPGTNQKDMFDVAVSAQLFNNRVTVNGNLGNKQYVGGSNNDLAGDIDVEIKVDKAGKFKVNLFSHSADQFTNYLDQTQRNGAGLVYQQEFDTFREFIRNTFWSKSRREEYERQQAESRRTRLRQPAP